MDFIIGTGKARKKIILPARELQSREESDRIREDAKALILRPATFANHSHKF